ncbi:ADP-glyceromanno-heptose 6-epimerase [Commensalibacter nepenthis]|uniref:ADP-L-glycero-D-manno-heptose-6-epimerase n=1 Tax=Commensalibacter nepenthis TaxID=3043872 RepID=A0ABT6Q6N6_9PROT|nr:ADP-glyceromanno-heptose 6-epimerase [Commensalibacter sp. TBRC 10068]MDI2112557.1 ADP-glyceromanno-heptose 6-epimerase [Commensalibacter sp. TBRC 10068]
MIIITGATGFIGSCLQAKLYALKEETVIVDWLGNQGKWRNIAKHAPDNVIAPENLDDFLDVAEKVTAVVHLGAISETTARDGDLVWQTNVDLSMKLWKWCAQHQVRFIYASSAATYGGANKASEFSDNHSIVHQLKPLNLYGWSKQVFDMHVLKMVRTHQPCPPQWVGLKFFNVYGPNEYHKDKMISVVKVKFDDIAQGNAPKLFKSDQAHLADGGQARDFIWVGDVVDMILWFIENPTAISGIYNCGTGQARTYLDLAYAVCSAMNVDKKVDFIEMPDALKGQYQYFTQANMDKIRKAGYTKPFTSLEDGIGHYIHDYLLKSDSYL